MDTNKANKTAKEIFNSIDESQENNKETKYGVLDYILYYCVLSLLALSVFVFVYISLYLLLIK